MLPEWMLHDNEPCKIEQFIECDEAYRTQYRNKAEFTFGYDAQKVLRLGYNRGSM
jgi:hypothetical protein